MEQLKFAEQKTETKLQNFILSISILSGHDISTYRCFIKNCIKLWEHLHSKVLHIYIDIDKILIALKVKNAGKVINVKLSF